MTNGELQPIPVEVCRTGAETEEIELADGNKERIVKIGAEMDPEVKIILVTLLRKIRCVCIFR